MSTSTAPGSGCVCSFPPQGALERLDLRPASEEDPDEDLECDVRLALVGNPDENVSALKEELGLHWMSYRLRHRMKHEGRELAHLSIEDLKALLLHLCDSAESAERWTWRFDEWTTFEAALLECEHRAEEAHHHRLIAIRDAKAIRECLAAENAAAQAWRDRMPRVDRELLLANIPDTLSAEDRIIVAYRRYAPP